MKHRARARVLVAVALAGCCALIGPWAQSADVELAIPAETWVARPVADRANSPGFGKHSRLAVGDDGLVYWMGGDHRGSAPGHLQSGRNEMYSYSVARNEWRLIQPYCRPDQGPQPSHADEVGWAWDPQRRVFWMIPGFTWRSKPDECPAGAQLIHAQVMSYDPRAGTWSVHPTIPNPPVQIVFAVHDARGDQIIALTDVSNGPVAYHLRLAAERPSWERVSLSARAQVKDVWTALDPAGRHLYVIPERQDRLLRYHVDTRQTEDLGPTPPAGVPNEKMLAWDGRNGLLFFGDREKSPEQWFTLHAYDPRARSWRTVPPPSGTRIRFARHMVFHDAANVLIVPGHDADRRPVMWLYRAR